MTRIQLPSLIFAVLVLLLAGCGTSGNASLYTEYSIAPSDVPIQTVAILPNRLPVNLQDDEKWRRSNFDILNGICTGRGFRVVNYQTAVEKFKASGLPLEDTKSSRDKYAELAEQLNADLLIFPYYSISYQRSGLMDINSYISVGTLQVYSRKHNDFLARIDFSGEDWFANLSTLGSFVTILGAISSTSSTTTLSADEADSRASRTAAFTTTGMLMTLMGLLESSEEGSSRWEKAFSEGLNAGMDAFFAKYVEPAARTKRTVTAPPAAAPRTEPVQNKYSSFSTEQLETMKQEAVSAKDFKTAGDINQEIKRRKAK
jgi:hypothetical protein